jgi:hypothetical protein
MPGQFAAKLAVMAYPPRRPGLRQAADTTRHQDGPPASSPGRRRPYGRQGGHKHSDGRAYYERKIAEGKTHKEALRCLKRRISDAIDARLRADARVAGPGGQPGNHSVSRAAGSHPARQLFGQATPGPQPTLRATAALTPATPPEPPANKTRRAT